MKDKSLQVQRRPGQILPPSRNAFNMVPQHSNPGEPPRQLSPESESRLESALRACARQDTDSDSLLKEALRAAAAEGRERGFRPEELVVVLKRMEERIEELGSRDDQARINFRLRMQRAMLEAYYRG